MTDRKRTRILRCLVLAICAGIAWGLGIEAGYGQNFRYESKPNASLGSMSYASPDPAPTMMVPAEAVGAPLSRQNYFDRRYTARVAQRADSRSIAPSSQSRVHSGRFSAPEPITMGKPSSPFVEEVPAGMPQDPVIEGDWGYGPSTGGAGVEGEYFEGGPMEGDFGGPEDGFYGEDCEQSGHRWFPCIQDWAKQSVLFSPETWKNFNEFGGVQAFKSPVDLGVNGNFGFHKGVNYAAPFWERLGIGWQLGGNIAISDFEGSGGSVSRRRDQYFVTTGLFRRAPCNDGFQGGAVLDYLHDDFYVSMNIMQVRAEVSYLRYCNEIGFWGAAHVNSDTRNAPSFLEQSKVTWQANNQYNFFFRRRFCNGGFGRMWIGMTNYGDVLFGSDATAVLSETWAIQAAYNYLWPTKDPNVPNAIKETWGVNFSLVWYPGYKVPSTCFNPYRPLFTVGDNSSLFLMDK